jgi:putative membrane protein
VQPSPAAGQPSTQQPSPSTIQPSEVSEALRNLPATDRRFIKQATSASANAVQLGQLAAERGSTPQVRALGKRLADRNINLTDHVRQAARQEGVILPHPAMTPDQALQYAQLSRLSGPEFDQAFMRAVSNLQQQTLINFQNEAINGQNSVLSQFANQALPDLINEVKTVQRDMNMM